MLLTKKDIKRHPRSSTTLFYYKDKLYRGIHAKRMAVLPLIDKCENIQPYIKTNLKLQWGDEVRPVIEHPILPHLVKVQELTPRQTLKVVQSLCKINAELTKNKFILYDIHEGNIGYHRGQPLWLDYGAIVQVDKNYKTYAYLKLAYIIHKYVIKDYKGGYSKFNDKALHKLGGGLSTLYKSDYAKPESWLKLLKWVSVLKLPVQKSHWNDKYSHNMDIANPANVNPKAKIVSNLLNEIQYKTVTDIACNKGYYSLLSAHNKDVDVVGFDFVEPCIDFADSFDPKARATFGCSTIEKFLNNKDEEIERYSSDLVIALAIVHHITFPQPHVQFAKLMASLTKKYLILEDINTEATYEKLLPKHGMKLVKRINSYPGSRKLSLYEKV